MTTGRLLLRSLVRQRRRPLAGASALFVSHQVGELMVPVIAGAVIDRAVLPGDAAALARWIVLLAVVFACLSTSWRWGDRILTRCIEVAGHDLRVQLAARRLRDDGIANAPPVGQVLSVATSDVTAAAEIQKAVAAALAGSAAVITASIVLLTISLPLGLVVLVGLPPVLWLLQLLSGPIETRAAAQQADIGRASATATDLLAGLRIVKGLHAETEAARRYRRESRRSLAAGLRASRLYAAHGGLTTCVTGVFVALIALIGGRLAADGNIGVGGLVAAIGVTQFLVGPLGRLSFAASLRAAARASADRVAAILDAPAAREDGAASRPQGPGRLRARAVRFGALEGLDLDIAPGEMVAIAALGPTVPAALAALLARRTDPDAGEIELDGLAFPELRLRELRRTVLVSDHDTTLFSGTVRENLLIVGREPTAALGDLVEAVAADEVIAALPDGLDSAVSERGMSLSGGQRQRLVLARCLVADPEILVLHEPTTAVDAVTEAQIAAGLRRQRAGRTTVVLTTSPALLAVADRVVFIENGRVNDVGRHDDLIARNAHYEAAVAL